MYNNLSNYEPFTFIEKMDTNIDETVNTNTELKTSIKELEDEKRQNYLDLSNNIQKYASTVDFLSENNDKYHYDDKQDPTVIIGYREPKDINSAIKKDIHQLTIYQNSIYITGVIACASLIIGAILIAKK
jgi:FtsZ-binding cell division protein ZapB